MTAHPPHPKNQEPAHFHDLGAGDILAAKMGHEINNVVHSLAANLKTLRAFWPAIEHALQDHGPTRHEPPARAELIRATLPRMIEEMETAAQRIGHIATSVKQYARSMPEPEGRMDLGAVFEAARGLVSGQFERPVQVINEIPTGLPRVRGDEYLLGQVFANLLLNAAHALKDVTHEPVVRVCAAEDTDRNIVVSVADNGPGIPPEIMEHLFQPFFTTRRGHGGTGLGLFISREIVRRHKGRLSVKSHPGQGAIFTLTLPGAG